MKLTTLIPCYNHAKTIKQVLNSIINQSYLPDELIIVNDCSTDNSQEVIDSFYEEHKVKINIKIFINKKNQGIRNLFLNYKKEINYEILFFGSADDCIVDKNFFLDAMNAFLENKNLKMFFGNFNEIYMGRLQYTTKANKIFEPTLLTPKDYNKKILLAQKIGYTFSPSSIYCSDIYNKMVSKNEYLYSYEDTHINNLIGLSHYTFFSPKVYTDWTINLNSFSRKNQKNLILIYLKVLKIMFFSDYKKIYYLNYKLKWLLIYPLVVLKNLIYKKKYSE